MALVDIDLATTPTGYEFVAPTDINIVRMKNRFVVQFLSRTSGSRGSFFIDELAAGRIRTNADIVQIFALSANAILAEMRDLALEIVPIQATLQSFTFLAPQTVRLVVILQAIEGTVIASLDVVT